MYLTEFPWKDKYIINELFGSLYIQYNKFESFIGCPKIIHEDCDYLNNPIKNDKNMSEVKGIIFNEWI